MLIKIILPSTFTQGNMEKFWGDYRGVVGKSGLLEHKSGSTCIFEV